MTDPNTIAVYNAKASDYASLTQGQGSGDARLREFIAGLPKGGRVLDLGCGPGFSSAAMAKAGLTVDALDASSEMVLLAGRQSGVVARRGTFDDLDAEQSYDGIWASFSLLHASAVDLPRHLAACHRALRPGGRISVGMKLGCGEARDRLGRFYCYVTVEELEGLLTGAGFTVTGHVTGRDAGLDGIEADWVVMSAHA